MGAAFAYTVDSEVQIQGTKRVYTGTYTCSGGSTGGDIVTPLTRVTDFSIKPDGAAVDADCPTFNETLPLSSGTVTIVTTADSTGRWRAEGNF